VERLHPVSIESVLLCADKVSDSKDEFVSLLPKLKTRVADTPGNVAEMLSKELARVCMFDSSFSVLTSDHFLLMPCQI